MATPAELVARGDIDGDKIDDLIGIWPGQGGVWVKYSSTGNWALLSSTARDIDGGKMRAGAGSAGITSLPAPAGGYAEGPGIIVNYQDLLSEGPGGWNFVFQVDGNLVPQGQKSAMMRTPGPGQPGFRYIEQKNLVPQERIVKKKENMK